MTIHSKSNAAAPEPSGATLHRLEQALEELVALELAPLPPYPAVALAVQAELQRKGFALSDAARLLGADPVLAASVLRAANSAAYRGIAPVTGLTQAIARIGTRQLTRLLFAACLSVHAQAPGPLAAMRRMAWVESVASAAICQELAVLRQLRPEEAFLLGLLHDFGKVVTYASLELLIHQRRVSGRWTLADWKAVVDRHHQALGARTARSWGLPLLFTDVIGAHHATAGEDPASPYACEDPGLLAVVRTSDRIVALLSGPPSPGVGLLPPGLVPEEERGPVLRVLEGLPELITAFEPEGSSAAEPSPVVEPVSGLGPGQRPVRSPLEVKLADGAQSWAAATVGPEGLSMVGRDPLPEGQLLRVTLAARADPFTLWTLVALSRRAADGAVTVELRPFSLGGLARERWLELVAAA